MSDISPKENDITHCAICNAGGNCEDDCGTDQIRQSDDD